MKNSPFTWETLVRYVAGDCTEAETTRIDQWRQADPANEQYINRFRDVWQLSGEVPAGFQPNTAKAWEKVKSATARPELTLNGQPSRSPNLWYYAASVAAVLIIGVLLFALLRREDKTPSIATMVKKMAAEANVAVTLADGSQVWLNKGSKLNYPDQFYGNQRAVYLEGEAYFEVAPNPGKPFIIHAAGTVTKVLGTSFNVQAYHKDSPVSVSVNTGKVSFAVEEDSRQPLLLTPGEEGVWSPKAGTLAEQPAGLNTLAWHTQTLVFRETNIRQVAEILNHYFGTNIRLANAAMGNCHFTGTFKQANLTEILEALKVSLNADYTKDKQEIVITGNGC